MPQQKGAAAKKICFRGRRDVFYLDDGRGDFIVNGRRYDENCGVNRGGRGVRACCLSESRYAARTNLYFGEK